MVAPNLLFTYADALQLESERVVGAVQAPLKDLVSVRLQTSSSTTSPSSSSNTTCTNRGPLKSSAQPVLTLHFARPDDGLWRLCGRNGILTKRTSAAMDAATLVWSHVRLLWRHPELRAAFWKALLSSKVMLRAASDDTLAQLTGASEHFGEQRASMSPSPTSSSPPPPPPPPPMRIVLDFGSRRARLDRRWFDALYKFLTDQHHEPEFSKRFPAEREKVASSKVCFGLCFSNSCLTPTSLVTIQRLLDCVAPGHNRHFGIDMLDLSRNVMTAEHLDIVTAILKRRLVYQIADIRLDNRLDNHLDIQVLKNPVVRQESAKVQDLLAAAFVVTRIPTETHVDLCATQPRISLATNPLGVEHFISVCSSLRYGCAFEELSLASMLRSVAPSERALCWRWLAFGVFYPRSSRFAALFQLRKVELRQADVSAEAVEAFANALYNPVAEFRRPGHPEDAGAMDAVLVGAIREGATVYALADSLSTPLLTLAHTQELEILHCRSDTEWVCVVVAGVGLGWVAADDVLSVERDTASDSGDPDSGSSSGAAAARLDLVVTGSGGSRAARALTDEAHTLIETVGRQLRSLAIRECASLSLQDIVYHCKHMQHLDLEGCELPETSFRDLHGCLYGHFGKRILSLNLSRTGLTNDHVAALAKLLGNPLKLPLLRELRLRGVRVNHAGLESLHAALAKNKNRTLAVLELEDPGDDLYEAWLRSGRSRITADVQNEPLAAASLSLRHRLATSSAVADANAAVQTGEELEPEACESAFRFAEEEEEEPARRKIIWTKSAT